MTTNEPSVATTTMAVAQLLPPDARPGECYAKVFIPEQFESRTESVCTRQASERLEIIPAKYEWVEESVIVKEASSSLEEVPAEFEWREQTIETEPSHTGWRIEKSARCVSDGDAALAKDVYCLVSTPPVYKTVKSQVQVKPATFREVVIPAEYQTVRRQKLASPAVTRRIPIPAEYATVEKTMKVADSRVEWQRVVCQLESKTETLNAIKDALASAGYEPGPRNGEFGAEDWVALKGFQQDNDLGVGELTYQTMEKLGVEVP
jgi:hypothetical protein